MRIKAELESYGINSKGSGVHLFSGKATPELIDYLNLLDSYPQDQKVLLPDGVVENQGRPLLFFVNESKLADISDTRRPQEISHLRRTLACRGDRTYLAVICPGTIEVIPVSLSDKKSPTWKIYRAGTEEAQTFFSKLAMGRCTDFPSSAEIDFVFSEMFQLVDKTASRLDQLKIKRSDTISLIGRALFFRFLMDRNIVTEQDTKKIAPQANTLENCFDGEKNAASTSHWLDKTFNGDFLPLTDGGSQSFFSSIGKRTGQRVFDQLCGIVRGEEPHGDRGFQLRLPIHWGHLDFAHIPVGLLSQVYEKLSWKWDNPNARSTSVHYTPRNIAATLVGEAFENIPSAQSARILDPACGAGVFLVTAFRRIYRELWRKNKNRPNTGDIRKILEQQLVGFDISESALKLSALSLYLTAIELDPDPLPPEKLKFKKLLSGKHAVLFNWRKDDDKANGPVIGSLGDHVGSRFDNAFDLVLCNPPWTNIPKKHKTLADNLNRASKRIVSKMDADLGQAYQNPDSDPDLPFLWKSLEWCKPSGRIAMALPARTLIKQGSVSCTARETLFRLITVTGIINCSNLRKTKVWPDMDQPFMLLFAKNQRPKPNHYLHFISPHTDQQLNSLGEFRIDSKSAQLVSNEEITKTAWLLKALSIGTALDVNIVRKVKSANGIELKEYWGIELGLSSRSGYQIKPNQQQRDAKPLQELKNLRSINDFRFSVDTSKLDYFDLDEICWPRIDRKNIDPLHVYRGPIVLIKESPGSNREDGWAHFCPNDVAYTESHFGYSGNQHKKGEILTRYLQLLVHSKMWVYYALLTSSKLGFERPNLNKKDIDDFPIIPLENLSVEEQMTVQTLSQRLIKEDLTVFSDIDSFFGNLYGLSRLDMETIQDTLEVREPNDELGIRASQFPTSKERSTFIRRMTTNLRPLLKVLGKQPEVKIWNPSLAMESPFIIFQLGEKGRDIEPPGSLFENEVLPLANETGATQIIKVQDSGLLIALLGQYRYWTPTRARILCAEITRNYFHIFED